MGHLLPYRLCVPSWRIDAIQKHQSLQCEFIAHLVTSKKWNKRIQITPPLGMWMFYRPS